MRATIIILIILGLAAAISAAVLVNVISGGQQTVAGPTQTVEEQRATIVRALRDMEVGEVVLADMFETEEVRIEEVPSNAVRGDASVVGQVLSRRVREKEVFRRHHFARDGSGEQFAAELQEGKRAMTIPLTDAAGLEGLVYPGARVDIIASFDASDEEEDVVTGRETLSSVILENIKVLGTNDRTVVTSETDDEEGREARRTTRRRVTLEVDGKQAEVLHLAIVRGEISLVLRNPKDEGSIPRPDVRNVALETLEESGGDDAKVSVIAAAALSERFGAEGRGTLFSDLSWNHTDRLLIRWLARQHGEETAEPVQMPILVGPERVKPEVKAPTFTFERLRGPKREVIERELPEQRVGSGQTAGTS